MNSNREALESNLIKLTTESASNDIHPVRQHAVESKIHDIKQQLATKRRPDTTWDSRMQSQLSAEQLAAAVSKKEALKRKVRENSAYNNEMRRFGQIDNAIYHQLSKNRNNRSKGLSLLSNANMTKRAQQSANLLYKGVKPTAVPEFPPKTNVSAKNKRQLFEQYGIHPLIPFEHKTNVNLQNALTNSQGGRKTRRKRKTLRTRKHKQ
jgi:hypothetical protein